MLSSSGASTISSSHMWQVIERLKANRNRISTRNTYLQIWRNFNKFLIRLDEKPDKWEQRVALYCAFLIEKGNKSSTVKSYVSAIKRILTDDGYCWSDNLILLSSMTRACRLENDKVFHRLSIQLGLLELVLFEIERLFNKQEYLEILYKTIFVIAYYGMFRVSELASDGKPTSLNHTMRAKDVHIAQNKEKLLIILYTSKTHGRDMHPQKIKITAKQPVKGNRNFCPFTLMRQYLIFRGDYEHDNEQFFICRHGVPITPQMIRKLLKLVISRLGLNPGSYGTHSFRVGRTSDLVNKFNLTLEEVKRQGCWRSNAVYKYIRD